jgi:aldehyde:ferredoxin oxidoreductase
VKRAAEKLGPASQKFAMHVKGQELPMHEPRGKKAVGLQYAISPTGADHMEADHDPSFENFGPHNHTFAGLGLIEPVDRFDLGPKKVRALFYTQQAWSLYNCIGMCDFVGVPINPFRLEYLRDYVNAATGWNTTVFELLKVGERSNNLARLFNLREGFTAKDDTLPDRLFEGLHNGKLKGQGIGREEFDNALKLYYQMAGWDGEGIPTPGKLAELDLL